MKVAIAGGGWYGCHIASALKSQGVEVALFERNERLFSEASGNNQFRLHQGLHYARSSITRHQSRDGYHRFVERYPRLSQSVAQNIYLVPKGNSLIDFETYFSIMLASGISVERVPVSTVEGLDASKFEGAVRCEERVVLTDRAREHFGGRLNGSAHLGVRVETLKEATGAVHVNGERFDYFVDATWGALAAPSEAWYYEPTLLLYYRCRANSTKGATHGAAERFPAVTLVDGPLWSIYPTGREHQFTLSSVTHTPLGRCASKAEAYALLAGIDDDTVQRKRALMEAEVMPYLPAFRDLFEYVGPQFAVKTKPVGMTDNRACGVAFDGRKVSVQSGKIDNIFFATDRILGALLSD